MPWSQYWSNAGTKYYKNNNQEMERNGKAGLLQCKNVILSENNAHAQCSWHTSPFDVNSVMSQESTRETGKKNTLGRHEFKRPAPLHHAEIFIWVP